ncbi:hypothetical protein WSM22_10640 [Cytophagales bacterium WSM2-2]|nr:hypothetical protein WSM22_10640 [Cytophagales bacterium WSM2-2]
MKTKLLLNVLFALLISQKTFAQVTLSSSPYIQNFNSIALGLPVGWTVRTGATASALGTAATLTTASTNWSNTTGSFKNSASITNLTSGSTSTAQSNSTDRVVALRQTGTFGDPGAAFVIQLSNTYGFSNFSFNFDLLSLDIAISRVISWKVDYGIGASPTSFTTVTSSPAAVTSGNTTWGKTNVTVNFGSALNNVANVVWIRIVTVNTSTGTGSRPTTGIDNANLSFTLSDLTPPLFTTGYPMASNLTPSGFDLLTSLNESGKVYYVVLPDGAVTPSTIQVKNGQDGTGSSVQLGYSGTIDVAGAFTEYSAAVLALKHSTNYDVYMTADDVASNLQSLPVKLDVRTNPSTDIVPPIFSQIPAVGSVAPTSFNLSFSMNEPGTTYAIVVPTGSVAPSSDQVKQGQDGMGNTLPSGLHQQTIVSGGLAQIQLNNLLPETTYDVYLVAEDDIPNLQIAPTKITLTTGSIFIEDFETCDFNSFTSFSASGVQTWGCVNYGYNNTKGYRMNGYSGSAVANEAWLISPVVYLSSNASLSFRSQFSFAGNSLQLKISTDYNGAGDPETATWTDLNGNFPTLSVASTSTLLSDWTSSTVDLSSFTGKAYVAFVYTSTSVAAARWTIDNIMFGNAKASYIQANPTGLSFSTPGISKSFFLGGVNLQSDLIISAPDHFLVSKDNITFSNSVSYAPTEVSAPQNVYVKFQITEITAETFSGSVVVSSAGVSSRNIAVIGTDKSQTFNLATYNLEFFGTDVKDMSNNEFGPIDDLLQLNNVSEVLQTIGADIFAVEEISDDQAFDQLVANLPGFDKIVSNRWSYSFQPADPNFPPQKIGFIYNTKKAQLISSRVMFATMHDEILASALTLPSYPVSSTSFWSSGRLPFMATFDVTINDTKRRIRMIDIHAKSGSQLIEHSRRTYDVKVLYDSLISQYPHENIILLGDFNDDVQGSILSGAESPYKPFIDDALNFKVVTRDLKAAGLATFPGSNSFIDHIIISNELTNALVDNSTVVEDARKYIPAYSVTTSDHLPVSMRLLLSSKADQDISINSKSDKTYGDEPFEIAATSSSGLTVSLASSDPNIILIEDNVATILGAGIVTVTASQPGDSDFNPAKSVELILEIEKADQTILFESIQPMKFGDAPFTLPAVSSADLPIIFTSSDPTILSVTDNIGTIRKAGEVTITATQTGDINFNAAEAVVVNLVINKSEQTISLIPIIDKTQGDPSFVLQTTSSSGLAVAIESISEKISITGLEVTLEKPGRVTIVASQQGNENYNAAATISQSFCIKPTKPEVTITDAGPTSATLMSNSISGNQWFMNGTPIIGETNSTLTVSFAGVLNVQTHVDDCFSEFSDSQNVITDAMELTTEKIELYPNPAEDFLFVAGMDEVHDMTLIDCMGAEQRIFYDKYDEKIYNINLKTLSSGLYLLIVNGMNTRHQFKFIKK